MENNENIFEVLNEFEKKNPKEMTPILEDYLHRIAKTGDTVFPWSKLKPVFLFKLDCVMQEFFESSPTDDLPKCPNVENIKFEVMRKRLLDAINNFNSAPFTIQRLCEMITYHKKHYTRTDKFLRGIEKNVLVVSTVQPGSQRSSFENNAMVNGLFSDSSSYNGLEHHANIIPDSPRQIASSSAVTSWPSPDSSGMEQDNSDQAESADALDGIVSPHLDDNKLNNNPDSGVESESDSDDSGLPSDSIIDNMESVSKETDIITEELETKSVTKNEMDSMEDIETKESIEETNIPDSEQNMLHSDSPSDDPLLESCQEQSELSSEEVKMSDT